MFYELVQSTDKLSTTQDTTSACLNVCWASFELSQRQRLTRPILLQTGMVRLLLKKMGNCPTLPQNPHPQHVSAQRHWYELRCQARWTTGPERSSNKSFGSKKFKHIHWRSLLIFLLVFQ